MKTITLNILTGIAALSYASAAPILVGTWQGSSGDATEFIAIENAITVYNASNADLPLWSDTTLLTNMSNKADLSYIGSFYTTNSNELNWTAPNNYEYYYLMTKWGSGQANFDHVLHYLLAGETLIYNPGDQGPPNGLSHVVQGGGNQQRVPDGGSMLVLLGLGLTSVEALRRKLSGSKA